MLLVSFASTLGATLAMLVSRTLLRDWVQKRFTSQFVTVNQGWTDDGGFYLFSLRMVPLIPFFMVNLVMGLTGVSVWQFYWVSQVGMLAATFVFVFAGTQLAAIDSLSGILSPGLIVALSLLGLFPLLAKKSLVWLRRARARS
ncbi:MAG: VTT domain-containing protein, partial [Gammaproteobacteria bacterium]|nr:VTT domain-containing protein [Gammaproteobacteria bacterium]